MQPVFITKLLNLFQAVTLWITILAIPAAALVAAWHAMARSSAMDDMEAMHHSRAIRSSIIYGGVTLVIGSVVTAALGYLK